MQAETILRAHLLQRIRSEDWITWLLTTATVMVVVRSVEVAEWVPTSSLVVIAILGALLGFASGRLLWKAWQRHFAAIMVGATAVYLQGVGLVEGETARARIPELNSRLADWWQALVQNQISTDSLPFALILSASAWATGYLSAWAIFKRSNVWLAILPGAFGLVTNLTYLPEQYFVYLFFYLLAAMLLFTRQTSLQRQSSLQSQGIRYPSSLRRLWLAAAVVFSALVVGAVYMLPTTEARHPGLKEVWNVTRQPAEWTQQEFGRLFSAVGAKKSTSANLFGAILALLPNKPSSEEPVFFAKTPFASYWRARTYSIYTSGGWTENDTTFERNPTLIPTLEDDPGIGSEYIPYRVQVAVPGSYLYLPSAVPYAIDVPAQIETHTGSPYQSDVLTVRPKKRMKPGEEYAGNFLAGVHTEPVLRRAVADYPEWAKQRYLQLPPTVSERVKRQAATITRPYTNPYDKALALEQYLRTFTYGTSQSSPRFDEDRVEHFLFSSKTGHSDHFASAMAVMLRAVGIPARLVTGYGPGIPDPETKSFVVREKDQHSWTEAFFPGLGWVEFEPSPIFDPVPRTPEELVGFNQALAKLGLVPDPQDQLALNTIDEDIFFDEGEDTGGGRLPGGYGLRPFPLVFSPSPLGAGGVILGVSAALWIAMLWWGWRRFILSLPRPELAYQRLHRLAGILAMKPQPPQTPLEFGRGMAAVLPEAREEIALICETYSKNRYGRTEISLRERRLLRESWNHIQKAVMRQSLR
ncbi:MAG: transglutaminase domain-containing protein [Chloroflexi bacterium]|nr:transglutaminase domain-containing protein [Chloroflexota bacterium]